MTIYKTWVLEAMVVGSRSHGCAKWQHSLIIKLVTIVAMNKS